MTIAIAPTLEQQRRYKYEAPKVDRAHNRIAYKKHSPFEIMLQRDEIDGNQLLAAQKFEKHYWGALGHDVRKGDGYTNDPLEYPQTYHAQMIHAARRVLMLPILYDAIESQVTENMSLVELGQYLRPSIKRREIVRNVAVTVLSNGLDILAMHWGQKSRPG